ncbi:MAG: putative aminohydrolase SsnA [Ignavibacteriales bacterium]|nr:putative aminohydrolase SsnA [Ignavibacteriales bacterium]
MIALLNARIINFNPQFVSEPTDIIVDNGIIHDVGKDVNKKYPADKVIDLNGKFVSTGLVCSHNHFYSALARGIIANINPAHNFPEILQNLWWKLDRALDEESLYYSGLIGALEAIKCGTTSVIDHNASPSFISNSLTTLKKCFEEVGLRGILCYEVTDRNGLDEMEIGVKENIDFTNSIPEQSKPHLVGAAIGAHASFTLSDDSLKHLSAAVSKTKRGIHIHVAEDDSDQRDCIIKYRKRVIERLNDFDLLNHKSILAHGVFLNEKEIEIINSKNSFLIHNPRSNMNNSVGYLNNMSKVKNVALGTDGIGSNMFEETKFAYFKNNDAKAPLQTNDYLGFLQNGNEILHRYFGYPFGKVEIGYIADLVVYDYQPPTPLQTENLAGHFIFGFSSRDVETVIVNGKIVLENRHFPFDIEPIYREAKVAARKLWKRMDELPD